MGGGAWTSVSATNYVATAYSAYGARSLDDLSRMSVKQVYSANRIDPLLDPKGVIRECRDSAEHPETFPIILALDVTGSMGNAAKMCAAKLNDIMENLYGKVKDVEFLMMGIGDLSYDDAPIQATQFESDVRILDQLNRDCFPHLTPSSTGCRNIAGDIRTLNPETVDLYYVSRSYLTRHGAGPMRGECQKEEINSGIIDATNGENEWQGALRFGKLDLGMIGHKVLKDSLHIGGNACTTVNMVYTHLNYTNGRLETINGRDNVRTAFQSDHIFVSDQKDQMELLE